MLKALLSSGNIKWPLGVLEALEFVLHLQEGGRLDANRHWMVFGQLTMPVQCYAEALRRR